MPFGMGLARSESVDARRDLGDFPRGSARSFNLRSSRCRSFKAICPSS